MFSPFSSHEAKAARMLFDEGMTLFQEQRYTQALAVLQQAANGYRAADARGRPFNYALPNGISGLTNTLVLMGRCLHNQGYDNRALTFYEMSLVNAKFERRKPFKKFLRDLHEDMRSCYEHALKGFSEEAINDLLHLPVQIDASYSFPFSLEEDRIPLARLYEIDPIRYEQYGDFYEKAKARDSGVRLKNRDAGESAARVMSFSLLAVLFSILSVYIAILIRVMALR